MEQESRLSDTPMTPLTQTPLPYGALRCNGCGAPAEIFLSLNGMRYWACLHTVDCPAVPPRIPGRMATNATIMQTPNERLSSTSLLQVVQRLVLGWAP